MNGLKLHFPKVLVNEQMINFGNIPGSGGTLTLDL